MTFAEVLPHLAAGKRVRREEWAARSGMARLLVLGRGAEVQLRVSDLLATDWTLVEEPESKPDCAGCVNRDATIARLTREIREANDYAVDFKRTVERLTDERNEARAELAEAKAKLGEDPIIGTWGSYDGQTWIKVTDGRAAHFRYLRNVWRSDG